LQNIALSEENNNARNKKEKLGFQNRPETDQDIEKITPVIGGVRH
jgi:hypothetical protein